MPLKSNGKNNYAGNLPFKRAQKAPSFIVPQSNVLNLKEVIKGKEKKPKSQKGSFRQKRRRTTTAFLITFQKNWPKKVAIFLSVAVILILPIFIMDFYQTAKETKGRVLGISTEGYQHLDTAQDYFQELELENAANEFKLANNNFNAALSELNKINFVLKGLIKLIPYAGSTFVSGENLLKTGIDISKAGDLITEAMSHIQRANVTAEGSNQTKNITDNLAESYKKSQPAIYYLYEAKDSLDKVEPSDLPSSFSEPVTRIKTLLPELISSFEEFSSQEEIFIKILGHDQSQRYLLLFQNNAEIRATGGFVGSLALIDIDKGNIKNMEVPEGGVYDVSGQLKENIIAPEPLWLVNPRWNLQDANWFPDFPASAQKIIWFYEKSGGPTVSGVISFTPEILERLLEITGPISLPEYQMTITAENFRKEILIQSEIEYDTAENKPKKIIADLLPLVLQKTLSQNNYLEFFNILNNSLQKKEILFYFNDEELENKILEKNWGGKMEETTYDYLNIVHSNIGGGKTDQVIEETVSLNTNIESDGSLINTLTLTRIHKGDPKDQFEKIKNVDYVRFYLPKGSTLISASGFDEPNPSLFIYPEEDWTYDRDLENILGQVLIDEKSGMRINEEFGKTVFANWIQTESGQTSQVTLSYKLPFKIDFSGLVSKSGEFSLLVPKQPGTKDKYFNYQIEYPESFNLSWYYPDPKEFGQNKINFEEVLKKDEYFGLVWQR